MKRQTVPMADVSLVQNVLRRFNDYREPSDHVRASFFLFSLFRR